MHLHSDELDYELSLRGVFNLSTMRQKTQCVREFLRREAAGESLGVRPPSLNPTAELSFCANIVGDVCRKLKQSELGDAILPECRSRLLHVIDRVKRAKPEIPEEQVIAYDLISTAEARLAEIVSAVHMPLTIPVGGQPGESTSPLADVIERIRQSQSFTGPLFPKRVSVAGDSDRHSQLDPNVVAFKPRESAAVGALESAAECNTQREQAAPTLSHSRRPEILDVVESPDSLFGRSRDRVPLDIESRRRNEREPSLVSDRSMLEQFNARERREFDALHAQHAHFVREEYEPRNAEVGRNERANPFGHHRGERDEINVMAHRNDRVARDEHRPEWRGYHERPMGRAYRKTVPVHQWRIAFSGESRDTPIHDFLAELRMLQRAEGVSNDELFTSIVHLLSGRARLWYRSWYDTFAGWDDFLAAFKHEFLPPKYDYRLLTSISNRRQKQTETFAEYVNVMQSQFQHLSINIDEQHKLGIIEDNMLAKYAVAASTVDIVSLEQLSNICRRVDFAYSKRDVGAFAEERQSTTRMSSHQRTREVNEVEASVADDLVCGSANRSEPSQVAAAGVDIEVCEVRRADRSQNNGDVNRGKCYNCSREGHVFANCTQPKTGQFCYRCGSRNVTTFNCPDCSKNGEGGSAHNTASNSRRQ